MPHLDTLMQNASTKLADMDYPAAEAMCLEALAGARAQEDWTLYARIVLPLQEARRQRRMNAADAPTQLGTAQGFATPAQGGCVVMTHPHTADDAKKLHDDARKNHQALEVLFADNAAEAPQWTLKSFAGPPVSCTLDAPPTALQNTPLHPDHSPAASTTPRHWFARAAEALGNAALEQTRAFHAENPDQPREHLAQLEAFITACGDHELLHQALADAAGALGDDG